MLTTHLGLVKTGRVRGCFIRVIRVISGSIEMDFEALGAMPLFIFVY